MVCKRRSSYLSAQMSLPNAPSSGNRSLASAEGYLRGSFLTTAAKVAASRADSSPAHGAAHSGAEAAGPSWVKEGPPSAVGTASSGASCLLGRHGWLSVQ